MTLDKKWPKPYERAITKMYNKLLLIGDSDYRFCNIC